MPQWTRLTIRGIGAPTSQRLARRDELRKSGQIQLPARDAQAQSAAAASPETRQGASPERIESDVQVIVRDNNVDQALKALKKKMQREGIFREMKLRNHYEKPSEKKAREKAEAIRRARKLARKRAQREGLIPSKRRSR